MKGKPHVVFVHQTFSTTNSEGSGRANAIAAALVRKGYAVSIVAGANSYLTGHVPERYRGRWMVTEECDGYTVFRPWTYSKLHKSFFHRAVYFLAYMFTSAWVLLKIPRFALIVGCSPPITVAVVAYLAAIVRRATFIFEVRDLWPAFPIEMRVITNPIVVAVSRAVERWLYRGARLVVINSPGFIPYLHEHGVYGDRLRLVPNGVDVRSFAPMTPKPSLRAELGLEEKFIVLYIGAHGPANALDTLLDAAGLLLPEERIHFLLIGDGKQKAALVERARARRLENVTFLSPRPKNQIPEYIALSDLCYASLQNIPMFTTTYPNKIFDYLACGKPILTTIDGVSREVVEKAGAGLYVTPADPVEIANCVRWCESHPLELRDMGQKGRTHAVDHWDRDQFAAAFSAIVNEAI